MTWSPKATKRAESSDGAREPLVRRGVWMVMGLLVLTCVVLAWRNWRNRSAASAATDPVSLGTPAAADSRTHSSLASQFVSRSGVSAAKPIAAERDAAREASGARTNALRTPAGSETPGAWSGAQPTAATRELVARLLRVDGPSDMNDALRALKWASALQQLLQQGDSGVAAIREFLATGTDRDFGEWGRANLGFGSVRLALFDALAKSGSADARAALAESLQAALEPAEVGTLMRHLESLAPGQYREPALQAARATLAAAERGELPDRDLAPAFAILQKFGGADSVLDLDRLAAKYPYYSAIALAQMPDGAGLSQLIAMSRGEGERAYATRLVAQQMLATLAPDNPAAREALLENVRAGLVVPGGWSFLASALEGRKFGFEDTVLDPVPVLADSLDAHHAHLRPENQRYFLALDPGAFTPGWADQQLGLIDQLLGVTQDRAAAAELQRVKEILQARKQQPTPDGVPQRFP